MLGRKMPQNKSRIANYLKEKKAFSRQIPNRLSMLSTCFIPPLLALACYYVAIFHVVPPKIRAEVRCLFRKP